MLTILVIFIAVLLGITAFVLGMLLNHNANRYKEDLKVIDSDYQKQLLKLEDSYKEELDDAERLIEDQEERLTREKTEWHNLHSQLVDAHNNIELIFQDHLKEMSRRDNILEMVLNDSLKPVVWEPDDRWRVLTPEDDVWYETSKELEALDNMKEGRTLQRLWRTQHRTEWRMDATPTTPKKGKTS